MGILYIVATPIGNLSDITLRAINALQSVDIIACEDTRRTGILLSQVLPAETKKPRLISYYEQNEAQRIPEIMAAIKDGLNIALVSDAGTPTISDPGFKLVRECLREGFRVESIPGPSSVISALVSSGLPTDKFMFVGFPPKKSGHRVKFFENIAKSQKFLKTTVIVFESSHRIRKTLDEFKNIFGDISVVVSRELTKIHEEIRREKISESIAHFENIIPKGEFIILFHLES